MALEISLDKEILNEMDQKDAHMIGYTAATESMIKETKEKKAALKELKHSCNTTKISDIKVYTRENI